MSLRHLLLMIVFFIAAVLAGIEPGQAVTVPSSIRDGSTRFLSRSLGSACYTMDSVQRGLPCNPAAIAKERAARFDADLFLGSRLDYLKQAEQILRGDDSPEAVTRFFSYRDSIETEISLEASFQASKWGVSFEPYRIVAITRFENPSLPMVDLVIAEEQSVKAQVASYVNENFYAGLQARYTHVRFIGQYFALSEALAGNSQQLFQSQTQDLLYLEPGFLYALEHWDWQPQISAVLTQWGFTSEKTDQYPIRPEGLLGASIKPVLPLGLLELGLQFRIHSETENARDTFRLAAAYQLGILQAVGSISENDSSAGFLLAYGNLTTGLSYWDQKDNRGVFVQLGVSL